MADTGMRETWDAAASSDLVDDYVGDPATARAELDGFLGRLGDDGRGGVCVEVGCGPGRMTALLAQRFHRVVALDVSEAMLERARNRVTASNVDFRVVGGERLDSVEDGIADVLVCYLVLQHLPARALVASYFGEFGRVLAPDGLAFVQIPVVVRGLRSSAWRAIRRVGVPITTWRRGGIASQAAYRGVRLDERELEAAVVAAGLRVAARDESSESPYRYAREVFLRLGRTA